MNIKWLTLENSEGTRTLSQHAFKATTQYMRYTGEEYDGNKALCSNIFSSEDGEYGQPFKEIAGEMCDEKTCCKKCLKIARVKSK